jgi:hypothetical protein
MRSRERERKEGNEQRSVKRREEKSRSRGPRSLIKLLILKRFILSSLLSYFLFPISSRWMGSLFSSSSSPSSSSSSSSVSLSRVNLNDFVSVRLFVDQIAVREFLSECCLQEDHRVTNWRFLFGVLALLVAASASLNGCQSDRDRLIVQIAVVLFFLLQAVFHFLPFIYPSNLLARTRSKRIASVSTGSSRMEKSEFPSLELLSELPKHSTNYRLTARRAGASASSSDSASATLDLRLETLFDREGNFFAEDFRAEIKKFGAEVKNKIAKVKSG